MKKFIPFAHAKSVYEIDIEFYIRNNVKNLFLDLDNTLDSYKCRKPSKNAISLIKKIKENGVKVYIISNNRKNRVNGYASRIPCDFLYKSFKPFPLKINRFIKENGLNKNECMIVGDQLMTDVLLGYNAKIRVVLTEKIVKEDQPTTRINRLFDNPIRKKLFKKKLLIDWREK